MVYLDLSMKSTTHKTGGCCMSRSSKLGPRPDDELLFSSEQLPALKMAADDLSFLRSRGYSSSAPLKLVGDRYGLNARQRVAILGASCSDAALSRRAASQTTAAQLRGQTLAIDGYNLLISLATATAGGVLIRGRDRAVRDLAGLHGAYRADEETPALLKHVGEILVGCGVDEVLWLLDSPIAFSGQLCQVIASVGRSEGWSWTARAVSDPDPVLKTVSDVVVTSDSAILDEASAWYDLTGACLKTLQDPWLLDWW